MNGGQVCALPMMNTSWQQQQLQKARATWFQSFSPDHLFSVIHRCARSATAQENDSSHLVTYSHNISSFCGKFTGVSLKMFNLCCCSSRVVCTCAPATDHDFECGYQAIRLEDRGVHVEWTWAWENTSRIPCSTLTATIHSTTGVDLSWDQVHAWWRSAWLQACGACMGGSIGPQRGLVGSSDLNSLVEVADVSNKDCWSAMMARMIVEIFFCACSSTPISLTELSHSGCEHETFSLESVCGTISSSLLWLLSGGSVISTVAHRVLSLSFATAHLAALAHL